ncbi:hypothetical protein T07_433, partial [Trichinella nelsoni]
MLEPDFYFVYKYYSTLVSVVLEKSSFSYQEINYEIAANSFRVTSFLSSSKANSVQWLKICFSIGKCIIPFDLKLILYSLHRYGSTLVLNYDSTVIKKHMTSPSIFTSIKKEFLKWQISKKCIHYSSIKGHLLYSHVTFLIVISHSLFVECEKYFIYSLQMIRNILGLNFVRLGTRYFVLYIQDWKSTK